MRHRLLSLGIGVILLLLSPAGGFAVSVDNKTFTTYSGPVLRYAPVCGNGILDPGEVCDDGKQCADGTPCKSDSDCLDSQWDTQQTGDGGCATRNGDGCASDCSQMFLSAQASPYCGNGIVEAGEACEPGNVRRISQYTCNDQCELVCNIIPVCGNGVLECSEMCEPPNSPGCMYNCQRSLSASAEPNKGIVFSVKPGLFFPYYPKCGNGILDAGEGCDDGNTANGDGCSASCVDEAPGPVCGNGSLEPGEGCEDGNTVNGDGCSANCAVEPPPVCGDGILQAGEECDDGNNVGGDGCNPNCKKSGP